MEKTAVNEHSCTNRNQLHPKTLLPPLRVGLCIKQVYQNPFQLVYVEEAYVWIFGVSVGERAKERGLDFVVVGAGARAALTVINEEWLSCSPVLRGIWALQCQRNIPAPKPPVWSHPFNWILSPGMVGGVERRPRAEQEEEGRGWRSRGQPTPSDLVSQPALSWEQCSKCVSMGTWHPYRLERKTMTERWSEVLFGVVHVKGRVWLAAWQWKAIIWVCLSGCATGMYLSVWLCL